MAAIIGLLIGAALAAWYFARQYRKKTEAFKQAAWERAQADAALLKQTADLSGELGGAIEVLQQSADSIGVLSDRLLADGGGMLSEKNKKMAKSLREAGGAASEAAGMAKDITGSLCTLPELGQKIYDGCILPGEALEELAQAKKEAAQSLEAALRQAEEACRTAGQIKEAIGLFGGLAEQLDLLALNAAIEASKMPEREKGISLLSADLRTIAKQCGRDYKQAADAAQAFCSVDLSRMREAFAWQEEEAERMTALSGQTAQKLLGLIREAGQLRDLALELEEKQNAAAALVQEAFASCGEGEEAIGKIFSSGQLKEQQERYGQEAQRAAQLAHALEELARQKEQESLICGLEA